MEVRYSLEEVSTVAKKIIDYVPHKTLLFYGDMGTGKTTLIKEICKVLGVKEGVSSPTFSIVNEYSSDQGAIYHFDLYRMEDEEEAYQMGIEEYLDSGNWIFIEWPERLQTLKPQDATEIRITLSGQNLRNLEIR
ncbi:tRNA (adenosine(37)-N6)-threonylcarbamoyltransferase complex ATPase subunit type 1 TsaE [Aquimarina brevivitae]|uniref:tRNA threonylcarbamoyladenosine biosynthesis protein TsaE n=1 Tax=Aquimarina brevivitae TaxID=323412 RepID=A0A4V2F5R2_9FLAO|nr:tRNA (adenosine(37)-N6)-threonylcarbamoyltransferase complex ATPase subunit type 1 TsaE [Aquimarina brevivitae]RZS93709.1 tRNA threonylcarbamoyladenosine biosynthesis protein TsaE [Aquimarina brevivitae]